MIVMHMVSMKFTMITNIQHEYNNMPQHLKKSFFNWITKTFLLMVIMSHLYGEVFTMKTVVAAIFKY